MSSKSNNSLTFYNIYNQQTMSNNQSSIISPLRGIWRGTILTIILTSISYTQLSAQGFRREQMPEGSYSPVTNINRGGYPRVLNDGSVMFRINAPQAQQVQIDLGGTKYNMQKQEGGTWTVTTRPQVPGFHYYSIIIDGVSVADPASQTFFGCSRWSSAIEIKEKGMDDFEVQDVPHGEVRTIYYYSKVEESWRPLMVYTPAGYNESRQLYPVVYIQHGGGEDHRSWHSPLPSLQSHGVHQGLCHQDGTDRGRQEAD